MDKLIINGGHRILGEVEISGAKNAAVAILPVAIIASKGKCIIENIPDIEDVNCIERILEDLGCEIKREKIQYL